MDNPFIEKISEQLNKRADGVHLAWAEIEDGQVAQRGIVKKADQLQELYLAKHVFEIGSISKVFTALLFAKLAEQGLLSLSDKLSQFIPHKLSHDPALTELLSHTSGLGKLPPGVFWRLFGKHRDNPYAHIDRSLLTQQLSQRIKQKKVGQHQYSNFGYGVLTLVLERATGLSYEDLLQEHICRPLQLAQTTTLRSDVEANLVQGLNAAGKPVSFWDLDALVGAGGVLSSCEDLAKFALHILTNPSYLAPMSEAVTQAAPNLNVGLGWHLFEREGVSPVLWHNGGTGGAQSQLYIDLEEQRAVVVLVNHSIVPLKFSRAIEECWRDEMVV